MSHSAVFLLPILVLQTLLFRLVLAQGSASQPRVVLYPGYEPLPNLHFKLDGRSIELGTPLLAAAERLVSLEQALTALTDGKAVLEKTGVGARVARVTLEGAPFLELPILGETPDTGVIEARVAGRHVPISDGAVWVENSLGARQLMVDLKTIAGLLGVTADEWQETVYLYTPKYWCDRIGLKGQVTTKSLAAGLRLLPDFGITPPAKQVLLWVRPPVRSYIQIYALPVERADLASADPSNSVELPTPLLGIDNTGARVRYEDEDTGRPQPWPGFPERPVRTESQFYENEPTLAETLGTADAAQFATYVAVVTTRSPKGGDSLAAIRSGEIPSGEWCVAGLRQRVGKAFVLYRLHSVAKINTLETPQTIADQYQMPLALLLGLNGLRVDDRLRPGDKILVTTGVDAASLKELRAALGIPEVEFIPQAADAVGAVGQTYEVEKGETVADLARRTGTSAEQIRWENGVPEGGEVNEGDLIDIPTVAPHPARKPGAPKTKWRWVKKLARTLYATPLYRSSQCKDKAIPAALPRGTTVYEVKRELIGKKSKVLHRDIEGWISTSLLDAAPQGLPSDGGASGGGPSGGGRPLPAPLMAAGARSEGIRVVREALKWEGVPRYVWGGNNIGNGIDCSHFVAAVFNRARVPTPSPPVHAMEDNGSLVHWKEGVAEEGGTFRRFPAMPSLAHLQPGDRIIFQCDPRSGRPGNHHIGIYIGPFRNKAHAYVHCNAGRSTVSVDELTRTNWKIYRYAVRGARPRRPGTWQMAASDPSPAPGYRIAARLRREAAPW